MTRERLIDELHRPRRSQTSTAQAASNKATLKRVNDAVNSGDLELISAVIDEVVEPDVPIRTPLAIEATGAQALKHVWATLLRAYPDLHVTIEDAIAEGDKVVSRNTVTGTHQGEYMGIPPTGKPSRTTRSSSSASGTAGSLRPGASWTSSRSCDSSAPSPQAVHDHSSGGVGGALEADVRGEGCYRWRLAESGGIASPSSVIAATATISGVTSIGSRAASTAVRSATAAACSRRPACAAARSTSSSRS
jgi:predicted ester cyclase